MVIRWTSVLSVVSGSFFLAKPFLQVNEVAPQNKNIHLFTAVYFLILAIILQYSHANTRLSFSSAVVALYFQCQKFSWNLFVTLYFLSSALCLQTVSS